MDVFGIYIPDKSLTNYDLLEYVSQLKILHFRGVFMRDELPTTKPRRKECGIVNFNKSNEHGTHWVCYHNDGNRRIFFVSFGQITPIEIQNYLKTKNERNVAVIQRNTDIVQSFNTNICGHLCLFVLKALSNEQQSFQQVLNELNDDGYS